MTLSPVPASDAQSHLSGRQKSNRNDALGQRQRLRRDVMRRQQQHGESSVSATTNDNEAARQDQQQNNNSENRQQQQQQRMTAVEVPVVPTLTPEQMYSNFEEWIKMCTDNVSSYLLPPAICKETNSNQLVHRKSMRPIAGTLL